MGFGSGLGRPSRSIALSVPSAPAPGWTLFDASTRTLLVVPDGTPPPILEPLVRGEAAARAERLVREGGVGTTTAHRTLEGDARDLFLRTIHRANLQGVARGTLRDAFSSPTRRRGFGRTTARPSRGVTWRCTSAGPRARGGPRQATANRRSTPTASSA